MPPPDAELERALAAARWEAHLTGAQVVEPRWDRLRGPVSDAEAWPPPPDAAAPSVPQAREARRVLDRAQAQAERRGRETYGLTDLVIGLLSETQGLGCLLLRAHGLTAEKARRAFDDLD